MEVTKHIGFSKEMHHGLWTYICQNNIPVDQTDGEDVAAIDILTSDPHWPWISEYMIKTKLTCLSDMIFSKEELQEAQWMRVRSIWRTGYPQPEDCYKYETITYTRDHYCCHCGVGLEQIDAFRIKRVPSWGRRHFFSLYWIEDEFFVSDLAKNAMQDAGITGITFRDVKNASGKQIYTGIQQLSIPTVLEEGLVESDTFIRSIRVCPECGTKKYLLNGSNKMIFRKEIFEKAPDVVKTAEFFGGMPKAAGRRILISQRTYRAIVDNHLDRSLLFYPIELG